MCVCVCNPASISRLENVIMSKVSPQYVKAFEGRFGRVKRAQSKKKKWEEFSLLRERETGKPFFLFCFF